MHQCIPISCAQEEVSQAPAALWLRVKCGCQQTIQASNPTHCHSVAESSINRCITPQLTDCSRTAICCHQAIDDDFDCQRQTFNDLGRSGSSPAREKALPSGPQAQQSCVAEHSSITVALAPSLLSAPALLPPDLRPPTSRSSQFRELHPRRSMADVPAHCLLQH